MPIQLLNPLELPNWDELISRHPNANPFHSSGWARVLCDTYGFKPFYACAFKGENLSACLPLMEVNSFLTGRRGVSLPFTDFCDPLLNGTVPSQELFNFAVKLGQDRHWKYLELRSSDFSTIRRSDDNSTNSTTSLKFEGSPSPPDGSAAPCSHVCASPGYSHHLLDLSPGPDRLNENLRASTRRNIRKAEKGGVTVHFGNDLRDVKRYFRLHCLTRQRQGVPPQPYLFFKILHKHLIDSGQGFVALADYQGKKVAGAVFLTLGNQALFKFGASDNQYHSVRPNNLVMWKAICRLSAAGFHTLSFGRTEVDQHGLIHFKSGWGGGERLAEYSRYDYKIQEYVDCNRKSHPYYSKVFQNLPIPLLRAVGDLFYKHFGA